MTKNIEQFLLKIQSVIGAKVISDADDVIQEVHIVSDLRRSPKQILRDVEAILISEFDQIVDYKKISVAQIKEQAVKLEQDPRIKLKSIEYGNLGTSIDVTITLEKFGETYLSTRSGIKTMSNMMRLVGTATLKAVETYLGIHDVFVFEESKEVELSNINIVVVTIISIYYNKEELYIGTAKIKADLNEAVARATLDAVNRHIMQMEMN